jgi:ferredoxin--NADP+ reductase
MSDIKIPEVELNIYTPKKPVEVPVVENYIVTKESSPNYVRHVTFDISGTELEGRVRVGQSIGILPPGINAKGRPHKLRLYSVSSPTSGENRKPHLISTTVKRTFEELDGKFYMGVCSNYLADLQPGDKVKMTGPSGRRFLLPENERDFNYIFFAAGTGIAPFRGMIMELFEENYENDCVLIFGCPYRTDLLYPDYFNEMAEKHENFHYLVSVSREERRADGSKHYVQSKLQDESELLTPILQKENTLIYICGLKGMETGIYRELARQKLYGFLDVRKRLNGQIDSLSKDEIKKILKPSARTFEEVY